MDQTAQLLIQWATITAAVMALAEWLPLPIGSTSPEPGKGTRKRYTALLYSMSLSFGAWYGGIVQVPGESTQHQAVAVLVLAVVAVGTAHLVVKAKKAIKPGPSSHA